MSITIFRTNKIVFYVNDKVRNSVSNKTIINKYNIPIEDKRSKISFVDKKIPKKARKSIIGSKESPKANHQSTNQSTNQLTNHKSKLNKLKNDDIQSELQLKLHFNDDNQSNVKKKPTIRLSKDQKPGSEGPHSGRTNFVSTHSDPQVLKTNTLIEYIQPKIKQTPGKLKQLKFGHTSQYENVEDEWKPFICKIIKRMFSKKLGRYIIQVDDGDGDVYNVHVATQIFNLLKNNSVNIGDWIRVNKYSATNTTQDKARTVIFVNIEKIEITD